jgi:hypothetical protein
MVRFFTGHVYLNSTYLLDLDAHIIPKIWEIFDYDFTE